MMESTTPSPASPTGLPPRLRALTIVLALSAMAGIGWAGANLPPTTAFADLIILTALAVLVLPFAVVLPGTGTVTLFGDTFLMAIAVMQGPSACVAAAAFYGMACCVRIAGPRRRWISTLSFSSIVCGALLYGFAFQLTKPAEGSQLAATVLAATAMALVAFVFSTALAATASWWSTGTGRWWERFRVQLPLFPNFPLAAAGAVLIARFQDARALIPVLVTPLIALAWVWTRTYRKRLSRATTGCTQRP